MIGSTIICEDIRSLPRVAKEIISSFPDENIFLISGKMGSGKTTLIKEICKLLDVEDVVSSPTFSIVNEYKSSDEKSIYHFDLYRIKAPEELMDIGYEEYTFGDAICLIEWPELAQSLMPDSYVLINIEVDEASGNRLFNYYLHKGN